MIDKILAMANKEWPSDVAHTVTHVRSSKQEPPRATDYYSLNVWARGKWWHKEFGNADGLNPEHIINDIRCQITPNPRDREMEDVCRHAKLFRRSLRAGKRSFTNYEIKARGLNDVLHSTDLDLTRPITASVEADIWTFQQQPTETDLTAHILRHVGVDAKEVSKINIDIGYKAKVEHIELNLLSGARNE